MASEVTSRKKLLNIKDTRIAGLYDLDYTIGQGHFAVVKLARHVFTGEKVACKIIDKTNLDPVSEAHIMQEVRCMKLVQHPNIVRLYEVIDTQTKLFLCLELGDYDMHDFIVRHEKGVAEPLAQQYFSQIITAIDYCHRLHVVHRDLKPENVVFFEKIGMVKLTDFGFSNLYEPGKPLLTSCGSLAYSAPEILLGDAYDAPAVDVWSLGVILFMLVCGRLPFQEANDSETLTRILDCKYSLPESLSTACKNLIQRMLVREPSKRANLPEIVSNPWVSAGDRGHASALPLIVQHELPHSAHTTIVEQMVAGNIASEDEILSALENDEYNSLTATYYLLAERILSSCREERAKELMAKESDPIPEEDPIESDKTASTALPGSRCRSRSNSWRARPCTILKEESEEELSSYLKSSRQSSRQLSMDVVNSCSHLSRDNGEDGQLNRVEQSYAEPSDRPTFLLFGRTPTNFDDLSPIMEDKDNVLEPPSLNGEKSSENLACNARRTRFLRNFSEPERFALEEERIGSHSFNKTIRGLVRRNSSPSVSMFSGSAKDRISPQAVHDLLEFSRLGNSRRAASPDSIRSSRSPSPPPSSSGRASPSISTLSSFARLKVAPASSSSGMRKLSSSPHLLGICEEGEEGGDSSFSSSLLTSPSDGLARTNRSASTGLVHLTRHGPVQPSKSTGSAQQPTTYSAVRMIRPRHAVVSPDVCRRYEQHQRFIARSRRSTSCSSSEASDDEEGKRLSLIASKYCNRKSYDNDKEDDDKGQGGQSGSKPSNGSSVLTLSKPSDSGQKTDESKTQDKRSGPSDSCVTSGSLQQLLPILEMPQLDSDKGQRIRARLLQRSYTAERILRDWAGTARNTTREDCCLGTPPREIVKSTNEEDGYQEWIKRLRRTRSDIDLRVLNCSVLDDRLCSEGTASDAVFELSDSSSEDYLETQSDSGCSSEKESRKESINYSKYAKHNCIDSTTIFDLTHCEKVNYWINNTPFSRFHYTE